MHSLRGFLGNLEKILDSKLVEVHLGGGEKVVLGLEEFEDD
jgi:hypothetical protein